MPATILPFTYAALPQPIYIDTTFLIRFLSAPNAGDPGYANFMAEHTDCVAFARRIQAESVHTFISDWVLEEFVFVRSRIEMERAAGAVSLRWMQWLGQDPSRLAPIVDISFGDFEKLQHGLGFSIVDLETDQQRAIRDTARLFMRRYYLQSRDAFHLAVCDTLGNRTVVTLDEHFARADGFSVLTCNRTILSGTP